MVEVGFGAVGLLFGKGWMVEGILRGLLCCEKNNAVKGFLLLVVVHAKEREEEERFWRLIGWRREVFIGRGILWIALGFGVGCLLEERGVFCGLYVCGWGFQSLWIGKGRGRWDLWLVD